MQTLHDLNGWPASLRENVANSDSGDVHYLDTGAINFFNSHLVNVVSNTGNKFTVVERVNYGGRGNLGPDRYRAAQFKFTWDVLGRSRNVSLAKTDDYDSEAEVMEVINRGFFED